MSKFRFILVLLCFVFVFVFVVSPTPVYAQAEAGDSEILVNGHFFVQTGEYDYLMITGTFNYGIFLSRSFEIGGGPSITYTGYSGDSDVTVNLNVFVRAYFAKEGSKTVAYVGGEGYVYDAFSSEGDLTFLDKLYLKPLVGLKYYFAKKAAFDIHVGYGFGLKGGIGGMISGSFGVSIII